MIMERKALNSKSVLGAFIALVLSASLGAAQTTLSGDHVVAGNLSVGTSATKGNLNVIGQVGAGAGKSLNVTGDGQVVLSGALGIGPGSLTAQVQPAFIWIPSKAAVRVGEALTGDALIGQESFSFGSYSSASGNYSFSATLGMAEGIFSAAFAGGTTFGGESFAAAGGSTYGECAAAFASGFAYGPNSFATGAGEASGYFSTAISGGLAIGEWSTAIGLGTMARAYGSLAVGRFNVDEGGDATQWIETDPLFVIGNGTGGDFDPARYRNAFAVYKNGDVKIPKRQGDILMGEFGNPE